MRTVDQVVETALASDVRLVVNTSGLARVAGTSVDGLFQTPLLALTILIIARARRSGLPTTDVATWTLGTLVRQFRTQDVSQARLQWSVLLRRRCVDALVFLENINLVGVRETPTRTIHISVQGRDFVNKLSKRPDEAGVLVRQLERAHHTVEQLGIELI